MITAFMVFRKINRLGTVGHDWELYYTTAALGMPEEELRDDALRWGWRVIKVEVSEDEFQGLAVTGFATL